MGSPHSQPKNPKCSTWMQSLLHPKEWSLFISKANHSILQLSKSMPQLQMPKKTVLWQPTRPPRTPKRDVLFIIGDWNAKVGSQEIPGVPAKFGLGVQNEAGQRLTEFCQENTLVIVNTLFQQQKNNSTHGHHQMVNTEIKLIIFFVAEDREALYSQQKQDRKLTVAQIMNSLLPNSDLNWRKWGKPLDHSGMT